MFPFSWHHTFHIYIPKMRSIAPQFFITARNSSPLGMSTTISTVSQQRTLLLATQPSSSAAGVRDPVLRGIARRNRHGMLRLQGIPSFNDPTAKRQWIRQHIAAAFRSFGKHEYCRPPLFGCAPKEQTQASYLVIHLTLSPSVYYMLSFMGCNNTWK